MRCRIQRKEVALCVAFALIVSQGCTSKPSTVPKAPAGLLYKPLKIRDLRAISVSDIKDADPMDVAKLFREQLATDKGKRVFLELDGLGTNHLTWPRSSALGAVKGLCAPASIKSVSGLGAVNDRERRLVALRQIMSDITALGAFCLKLQEPDLTTALLTRPLFVVREIALSMETVSPRDTSTVEFRRECQAQIQAVDMVMAEWQAEILRGGNPSKQTMLVFRNLMKGARDL